jgi:F-type H+-transporting ATPase subunit b
MSDRPSRRPAFLAGPVAALTLIFSPALSLAAVTEFHNVWDSWFEFSRILNFLIVLFALYFILRKPIRKAMEGRREGIVKAMKEAEEARAEAGRLREEYEKRTADLDKELAEMRVQAEADREALKTRLLKEGAESAERILEHARFTIEQETKKAEQLIRARAAQLALDLAEKALERELGPEDQRRFIKDYIAKVGEMN